MSSIVFWSRKDCLCDHGSLKYVGTSWKSAAAAAKLLQSCPTLCDPIDGSPPGSPIPGILQARTLEWAAISFSSAGKWKGKVKSLSRVWLLATPWTAAHQAPPSKGFSRQEYWSGEPLPYWKSSTWLILKIVLCAKKRKKNVNSLCWEQGFERIFGLILPVKLFTFLLAYWCFSHLFSHHFF